MSTTTKAYVNAAWSDEDAFNTWYTTEMQEQYPGLIFGTNAFGTLAEAAAVLPYDGTTKSSITLLGTDAISSDSQFGGGQDVTIDGTANVNWNSWMMIGRDAGEHGDVSKIAKVTFDGAQITGAGYGGGDCSIHISGAEADSSSKGYGQLDVINGSDVETAWVIDKNILNVNTGSTFTARQYLNVAGRAANEAPSGEDYEAQLNIDNATVNVYGSSNGSGLVIGNEGKGLVNLTNGAVLNANTISASEKSTINIDNSTVAVGGTFANAGAFTNEGTVNVTGTSKLSATDYQGNLNIGKVGAETTITTDGLTSNGNVYVADGSTVTFSGNGFQFGGMFRDSVEDYNEGTHTGYTLNIKDADSFKTYGFYVNSGSTVDVTNVKDLSTTYFNIYGGTMNVTGGTEGTENDYVASAEENFNVTGALNFNKVTAKAATLQVYAGVTGKLGGAMSVEYSVVTARFVGIGSEATSAKKYATDGDETATVTLTNSELHINNIDGEDASTFTVGGTDTKGTLTLTNSKITYNLPDGDFDTAANMTISANGAVYMDATSSITVSSVNNAGVIEVDMSAAAEQGVYKLIDATAASEYGTYQFATGKDNGYTLSVKDNDLYATNINMTQIAVNASWSSKEYGEAITEGETTYYYGLNAFSDLNEISQTDWNGHTVVIYGDNGGSRKKDDEIELDDGTYTITTNSYNSTFNVNGLKVGKTSDATLNVNNFNGNAYKLAAKTKGTVNISDSSITFVTQDSDDGRSYVYAEDGGQLTIDNLEQVARDTVTNSWGNVALTSNGSGSSVKISNSDLHIWDLSGVNGGAVMEISNSTIAATSFTVTGENSKLTLDKVQWSKSAEPANYGSFFKVLESGTLEMKDSSLSAETITNEGTVNVTGTSKLSATDYQGNLNIGKVGEETTLTTDGLITTSGNVLITDGATVTMSGNGFDFSKASYIQDSTGTYNDKAHTGFTLNIKDADSFKAYAIYPNGGSTINVSNVDSFWTLYTNVYGGTLNLDETNAIASDNANVTGTISLTNSSELDAGYFSIYAAPTNSQAGTVTVTNSAIKASQKLNIGTSTRDAKYYTTGTDSTATLTLTGSTATVNELTIAENDGEIMMDAASTIKVNSITNNGTITVDMADAASDTLYTIIDYQGTGTMTLADYGTVVLTNKTADTVILDIVDNDLLAGYAVAQIGDELYLSMENALAAAAESTEDVTIKVLRDTTLKSDFYSIQANLTITADTGVTITLEDKTVTDPRTQQALYFGEFTNGEAATPYHTVTIGENVTLDGYEPQQTVSNWTPNTTANYGYADIIINGKVNTGLVVWDSDVTVTGEVHDKSDRALFQDNTVQIIGTGKDWDTVNQYESSSFQALHSDVTFKDTKAYFNASVDHYSDNVLAVVADIVDGEGTASATLDNAQLTFTNNLITVGTRYNRQTSEFVSDSDDQSSTLTMENGSSITGTNSEFRANGTVTIDNTSSITAASFTNTGSITLGYNADNALITVTGAFTNDGTIMVDMADATEDKYLLIDGGEDSNYGSYQIKGDASNYTLTIEENDLYAIKNTIVAGKDYVVNSEWADKKSGDIIYITKDGVTYEYTFGETAFSNITGEDGVLTKIKAGKIITLYSDLSETGAFHIDKTYQVNLNGFDYTTTGDVYDSITIRNSTDSANTFTGGTLCTADYGYFSVNGINTAVFDTVKNAGGTVYLYTTALLKTSKWINEETDAVRGGRGKVYVYTPDLEGGLSESFYKMIDQDSSTTLTIYDYGWVGDENGITPSTGNYLWFYWKNGWEEPLPEGYKWATEDGDLVIIKYGADAPDKLEKQETSEEITVDNGDKETTYYSDSIKANGTDQDVAITANEESTELKVTGDVTSTNGDVTITDKGESLHITGDVAADGKTTIVTDGAADADATVLIGGTVSGDTVVIENKKESGASAVTAAGGFAVETLEIRNETSETLSASGKINVTDINIYNNDTTSDTKAGKIVITDQIEAAGAIKITNGNETETAGSADSGEINLGTEEHTAQDGLTIINKTENIINGGYDDQEAEQAANIKVTSGDVLINNEGHINANIVAQNSEVTIRNTSVNTLITNTEGEGIKVYSSGAIEDSSFVADDVTISLNGTIDNTQITAGSLTFEKSAYQVVTFDWESDKNFSFTKSFTVEGKVVIDAESFTGTYQGKYLLIDNQSTTAEDYSNVVLSEDSLGYILEVDELGDLYVAKNTVAPVITVTAEGVFVNANGNWVKNGSNGTLNVSVTDMSGSGLKTLEYTFNGGDAQSYSNPAVISLTDGAGTYTFNAEDNNGNMADPVSYEIKVDDAAPTIEIASKTKPGFTDDQNVNWYKQGSNAFISATAVDEESGVKIMRLNGSTYENGAEIRIETLYETVKAGTEYKFTATDNVGITTVVATIVKIGVDGTGPAIGDATLGGNMMLGNVYGEWIKAGSTATVTTEITDELSGFKSAALDNSGTEITYADGKFTITTTEGQDTEITEHLITAVDNVGNVSYKAVAYGIDGKGAEFGADTLTGTNVYGRWVKAGSKFAVNMEITDAKSGLASADLDGVFYKDGKFIVTAGAEADISEYTVTASDNVGNLTETTVSYGIDGTGPAIGETTITGANVYNGEWVKAGSVFAVETEITDEKSGFAAADLDGADYDGAKFTLFAAEEGDVQKKITATDNVGNTSEKEVSYRVDGTGPSITITSNPDGKLTTSVTLTATFEDTLSGLASAQYSFNGEDWMGELSESTITVANIAENKTVYFRATDNVGNVATASYTVSNIVVPENPYVVNEVTRELAEDLSVSDFSVINGGVVDGNEGTTLNVNNLYLQSGTVKNISLIADNVTVISGENDISGLERFFITDSLTVTSGELTISKMQYDIFFSTGIMDIDGLLKVTGATTISQKEMEKLLTSDSINAIAFTDAEISQINKLNFAQDKEWSIAFGSLTGTSKADTITFKKNATVNLAGAIDLGEGKNTIALKASSHARLISGEIKNVTALNVESGATYKSNGSSYLKETELFAGNLIFSDDRADTFAIGNYADVTVADITTGAKADKISIGKETEFMADAIDMGEGTDTIIVGKASRFQAESLTGVENLTFGQDDHAVVGNITGLKKLATGKSAMVKTEAVTGTDKAEAFALGASSTTEMASLELFAGNDRIALAKEAGLNVTGDLLFGDGKDTLSLAQGSQATIGSLNFGDGKDTLSIGRGATLTVTNLDVDSLETLTMYKDAKLVITDADDFAAAEANEKWAKYISKGQIVNSL